MLWLFKTLLALRPIAFKPCVFPFHIPLPLVTLPLEPPNDLGFELPLVIVSEHP